MHTGVSYHSVVLRGAFFPFTVRVGWVVMSAAAAPSNTTLLRGLKLKASSSYFLFCNGSTDTVRHHICERIFASSELRAGTKIVCIQWKLSVA